MHPALREALAELTSRLPPERIDQVWIFPPRALGEKESTLAVLSLFHAAGDSDRRDILTLRCEAERVRGRFRKVDVLQEQGSAPVDRVERVIDGVVRRLGDAAETPRIERVGGDSERWSALLSAAGGDDLP